VTSDQRSRRNHQRCQGVSTALGWYSRRSPSWTGSRRGRRCAGCVARTTRAPSRPRGSVGGCAGSA